MTGDLVLVALGVAIGYLTAAAYPGLRRFRSTRRRRRRGAPR